MKEIINTKIIESKIIEIRDKRVLIDKDIAKLYGVETKRINEVVKNNIEKFPKKYMFELSIDERKELVVSNDRFNKIKHSTTNPKAFTEEGLYMLATLLRSKKANEITFYIIETFYKIKELTRSLSIVSNNTNKNDKELHMKRSGQLFNELLEDIDTNTETTIELNLAVLKLSHKIKKK